MTTQRSAATVAQVAEYIRRWDTATSGVIIDEALPHQGTAAHIWAYRRDPAAYGGMAMRVEILHHPDGGESSNLLPVIVDHGGDISEEAYQRYASRYRR